MTARRLIIEDKVRPYPLALVAPDHFRAREAGPVDPAVVVEAPNVSLYCLDPARREAIFVETDPAVELSAAPFSFQAQYDAARGLIAVGFPALHELADRMSSDQRRLVLVYSIGRCGSTLVGRALAELGGATLLAEPDVFTQLVALRQAAPSRDGLTPDELSRLVRSCARLMFTRPRSGGADVLAVKFRSFVIELADVLHTHLRTARAVFAYRHAVGWTRSTLRAFGAYDPSMAESLAPVQDRLGRLVPVLARYRARLGRVLTPVEATACQWVSQMERAVALQKAGVAMYAVRYEDLAAHPRVQLAALLAHCGLPTGSSAALDRVLAEDSQAGTSLARDRLAGVDDTLDGTAIVELKRVIAELSRIVTPDLILHNGQFG
jgi:hypothetical protein